ncbi:MAG: BatA and WFA domain-containing protein [Vicinamibacterales bacterium]
MQFLAPLFLAGLAAVAIPIWLHLVRQHRAPIVPFTAVRLIKAAPVEQKSMRRLRDILLLMLRAAAVALLAIAFARPFFAQAASPAPVTVVALDVSASMSGDARFESAREAARKAVDEAPEGHRVAVAAFDHSGRTVLLPQVDRGAARAAIDRLQPGFGATRYAAAVTSAADAFDRATGRIVIVTDRQRTGWAGEAAARVPRGVDVAWVAIEPPARNLAVTALAVRGERARATVINGGREAAATRVSLKASTADGAAETLLGARDIEIAPGQTHVIDFAEPLPSAGNLTVTVADQNGLPADDVRHLVLDPLPARKVLIVTSGLDEDREAYYARHALAAAPGTGRIDVTIAGGTTLRDQFAEALNDTDVAIVLSTRGIERSGPPAIAAFRQSGGGVLLVAGPTAEPAVLAAMLDAGETRAVPGTARSEALVLSDARHPIFASLGPLAGALGSVRVTRGMFVESPRLAVLARYTSGEPALAERRRTAQEGRTLLLTTDIANAWNDLALHPAFVPLLHEMTTHLDGRPRRAREYVIGSPDAPSNTPGIAAAPGKAGWRTAVNVDPAESDSAMFLDAEARSRIGVDDRMEDKAAAEKREREADNPLWRYVIVAMLAMLLAEGLVGRGSYVRT